MKLDDRIIAYHPGSPIRYYDLATLVFPINQYPRMWHYSSNGGPPALVRKFTPALYRLGYSIDFRDGCRWVSGRPKQQKETING